jgi:alpha-D-ribose 1-methylphosphonate 5-triphosphate diphosphatase
MEFHAADPIVLTNANVVAADRVFPGWIAVESGRIVEIGEGGGPKGAIDCQGDYLLPGLSSCTPTISRRISCRGRGCSGTPAAR